MNFWETFRQVSVNTTKWWQYLREATLKQKGSYFVEIPPFLIPNLPILDASYVATEFRLTQIDPGAKFTLRFFPFKKPAFASNFCLAVRTPINNNDGLNVKRYKLWDNVNEKLYFPLYEGQVLTGPCAFEVWTTLNQSTVELDLPFDILLSILFTPTDIAFCCTAGSLQLPLQPFCELFANKN